MKISKNTIYMIVQLTFWMIYCSCYGFVSYYLVEKGFGTSIVGIVTATAGILSATGQPLVGAIADNPKIGWKKPLITVLCLLTVAGIALAGISVWGSGALICLSYGDIMLLLGIAVPLINTAGVAFPDEINFGIARGTGSFGYALSSYILGALTVRVGPMIIPIEIALISLILLAFTLQLPNKLPENKQLNNVIEKNMEQTKEVSKSFLSKYPKFRFLWIVLIFMLTVHCLSNSYLLQILEKAGGDSHDLGIAVAIATVMEMPMIFFYEKVNKYISAQNLLVMAVVTYLIRSVLQLWTDNLTVLYLIQFLQLTSWGVYASASVYYANEIIPEKDRSKGQAYMSNALTIGSVIGALVGGRLIDLYDVNAMLVFQVGMATIAVIGMIAWKAQKDIS